MSAKLHKELSWRYLLLSRNTFHLSRNMECITMTCQFSGLEFNINFINPPFSPEIEFTFHLNYLKTFSSGLKLEL